MMTKVRLLANSLLKGHQRSLEATNIFLSINLHWNDIEYWQWLHCVCLIKTHRLICNMAYFDWSLRDLNLKVKLWPRPFKVKQYIDCSVSTNETRWSHCRSYIFISSKALCEKYLSLTAILTIFDLRRLNLRTDGGGGYPLPPPRRFFVDIGKTAARIAAKFDMTIPLSLLHIICKLWDLINTLKVQVTRSVWMTRPHITFLRLWDRVRARVDDRAFWKLQGVISS